MALKGKAKTDYQREYMRRKRAGLTKGSNIKGLTKGSNKPTVRPKIDGLVMDGNRIVGTKVPVKPMSKRRDELTPEEKGVYGYDADGYPLYSL